MKVIVSLTVLNVIILLSVLSLYGTMDPVKYRILLDTTVVIGVLICIYNMRKAIKLYEQKRTLTQIREDIENNAKDIADRIYTLFKGNR